MGKEAQEMNFCPVVDRCSTIYGTARTRISLAMNTVPTIFTLLHPNPLNRPHIPLSRISLLTEAVNVVKFSCGKSACIHILIISAGCEKKAAEQPPIIEAYRPAEACECPLDMR